MNSPNPSPIAPGFWSWVPIRSLAPRHRPRIATHLLQLDEHDRYLRFGYPASDEQIVKYVDALDFERDELFGIFNRRLDLIAMAHLAYAPAGEHEPAAHDGRVRRLGAGQGARPRLRRPPVRARRCCTRATAASTRCSSTPSARTRRC
jgi:hypothetical protein